MNIQNWLKIHRMRAYNFGARESNLTKLFHMTCHEAYKIIWVQLFKGPRRIIW